MRLEDLLPGSVKEFDAGGKKVLLANIGGTVYAASGTCTHEDADLADGAYYDGEVACPLHGSSFDLRTGEALTPPAMEPLQTFPVEVRDGEIVLSLV